LAAVDSPHSLGALTSGSPTSGSPTSGAQPAGVIHDIGYRRYDGPRLGRGYLLRSLYGHSIRAAFGIGRGAKAKIFPWLMIALVTVVAIVAIAVRSITGQTLLTYVGFTLALSFPIMMFLAVVAPELVSRDLRDKVLPLYFSRPVRRTDYALVKLAALVSSIVLLLGAPQIVMFIGGAFGRSDGLKGTWDELGDLLPGLASAGIVAFVLAPLALFVASLTGRRAIAAGAVVAVFLVTAPVAGVLSEIGSTATRELSGAINPMTLVFSVIQWLFEREQAEYIGDFGPVYAAVAVALSAVSVGLLLARYRKVAA
jgi:ABC-2 type transport system permease protein